jgi:dipeptidyl aminopeptidase/acylaminoacyl peptidase
MKTCSTPPGIRFFAGFLLLLFTPWMNADSASAVENFIRYATYDDIYLSPKGTHMAVTHRQDHTEMLSVFRLPSLELASSTRYASDLGISRILWASEERMLIEPARRHPTRDDYKIPTGELAAMDVDGRNRDMLWGYNAGRDRMSLASQSGGSVTWARVIDLMPEDPNRVLIQNGGYGLSGMKAGIRNEAFILDVRNGDARSIARSPIRDAYFVPDENHQVNLLAGQNEAGDFEVYMREPGKPFQLLRTTKLNDGTISPWTHSQRPGYYYFLDSATAPVQGLVEWNPATNDLNEVFRHAQVDIADIFAAPSSRIWAIKYFDHFPYYHYPDPAHPLVDLHKALKTMFSEDDVTIVDATEDLKLALAFASGPKNPGTYFLLDVEQRALIEELEVRPWLRDTTLASVEPIEVKVRDGLSVRSYLTLPQGQAAGDGGSLPMIVLVHGGPHGPYDIWGFDPEAQLFASQGYAVLQVNYRGSGGRGVEFMSAGYGKWGAEMQDDITDTVRYAIAEGIADPERICIYGASYGGYSAMAGAYRDPDLYQCAVGYVGVYDLPMMFKKGDIPDRQAGINYLKEALGTDTDDLKARSPSHNAHKIKAATMLIHGKLDERAPFAHAQAMRKALTTAGNPPEWLIENREGHGFRDHDNRVAMYTKLLAFFDEHIGD